MLVARVINIGTRTGAEFYNRRVRLVNVLLIASGWISFQMCFLYAAYDFHNLKIASVWSAISGILWLSAFILIRYDLQRTVVYFMLISIFNFVVFGYMAGSSVGVHYHMLAAPCVLLLLGSRRILLAALLIGLMIGSFFYIELMLPSYGVLSPVPDALSNFIKPMSVLNAAMILLGIIYYANFVAERAEEALAREYDRSENLLLNLMPASIAGRLKSDPDRIIADQFDTVTILFADIVDFTPRAARLSASGVISFLNRVFSEFDRLVERHGLEKIKTIGDAYMVAGGMPEVGDGHVAAVANLALDMISTTARLSAELNEDILVRVGIHTGPAVAGVIGTRKLFYDVWGDTVNTAARMESHGSAGRIQVTESSKTALGTSYTFEKRGRVDIKGKGEMELYYLTGRASP